MSTPIELPPNWTIVRCPRCGDLAFAEMGIIRLHAVPYDSRRVCSGTGWMVQPNDPQVTSLQEAQHG
jgi:hypothetical protein